MSVASPLKYHGGKSRLASKIIELMPPHTAYLESHAGSLAVLMRKDPEGVSEYVNDLDRAVANFWNVLQHPGDSEEFIRWASMVPLSDGEFAVARDLVDDAGGNSVADAIDFFIANRQSRQGLKKDYCTPTKRRRRGMNENVSAWLSAVDGLQDVVDRMRRVEVWNRDACEAIELLDKTHGEDLLVYCDPPYIGEKRTSSGQYGKYEMTMEDHARLLNVLSRIDGKFILSGYDNPMYNHVAYVMGWDRIDFDVPNNASGEKTKGRKTECIWKNYA